METINGTETVTIGEPPVKKKSKKKWPIVVGIAVAVLIASGAGLWVWHEQPSFCSAICHTPMDMYNKTYDQELGTAGVDKWGNEVENTDSMLAVHHKALGKTCMDCHVPTLSEQVNEGISWITGNYTYPLEEKSLGDLMEARGTDADSFCLNESCHNVTRDSLIEATSHLERNPHVPQHGEVSCGECHKAHRASVNYCSSCHSDADIPQGWISADEEKKLSVAA